jgi:hypothetical protein
MTPTNELELRMGTFDRQRFNSKITLDQFNSLKSKLNNPTIIKINDTNFHNLPYRQRRINKDKSVWIKKEKIDTLDVPEFNMRIAFADEVCSTYANVIKMFNILNPTDFFGPYNVALLRKKKRYSEPINGWIVDLTVVENMTFVAGNWVTNETVYEFELELDYKQNKYDICTLNNFFSENIYYTLTNTNSFIGNYPATFERKDFDEVHTQKYSLTNKVDGERMFLIVNSGKIELMGKNMIRQCVCKTESNSGYLLDGEYLPESKQFLAFDLLYYKGKNYCNRDLEQRHILLDQAIAELNVNFIQAKKFYYSVQPSVPISFVEYTDNLFETAKTLWSTKNDFDYALDGLIFTPIYSTYNKYMKTFKWKESVTIDVLIRIHDGFAHMYGRDRQHIVPIQQSVQIDGLIDDKIYEFKKHDGNWVVDRERPDKLFPNSVLTIQSAMNAINQNITINDFARTTNKRKNTVKPVLVNHKLYTMKVVEY